MYSRSWHWSQIKHSPGDTYDQKPDAKGNSWTLPPTAPEKAIMTIIPDATHAWRKEKLKKANALAINKIGDTSKL